MTSTLQHQHQRPSYFAYHSRSSICLLTDCASLPNWLSCHYTIHAGSGLCSSVQPCTVMHAAGCGEFELLQLFQYHHVDRSQCAQAVEVILPACKSNHMIWSVSAIAFSSVPYWIKSRLNMLSCLIAQCVGAMRCVVCHKSQ